MLFEIKHRVTDAILFSLETKSMKLCVEAAWISRANLSGASLYGANISRANISRANISGADLSRADLSGADLSGADLSGADLSRASLYGASLYGADLSRANLSRANLSRADLSRASLYGASLYGADLSRANLYGADLSRANLSGADLSGADLSRADLSRANISRANGVNKHICTPLLMLLDQPGEIRAYKLVTADREGPYNSGIKYTNGQTASVENANTDDSAQCGAGINIATLDWCMREWHEGYHIMIVEFTAKDIAAIPIATDGKFRVHRCKVVGEKDLEEIGLIGPGKK